ncbi:choice-of-anchor D domain-containing protein [Flavobacterium sp. CYK-4]|uniref:choice-of-anchor D domain-containing protein n=1 Tax=Flavobacterium lotistagni TaxID=2709660 RepID=UPI001407C009|nr:choice-of-anchor D domain-containing protein [Flavobacterium lotistagni]NHM06600.1 choice-of-anchor D domain-containing protein [Flavobacterium lotistagni]
MKIRIFFLILLISQFVESQVTIVSDGLNNSSSLFVVAGGAYYTGNSAAGDRPATSPFAAEGTHGWGLSNGGASLLSSNINTTGYSIVTATFRLASFSIGSTGNGADVADIVTVEVSPNGGTNWYSTVRVLGNANAYWSFSSGTGNASTAYDGDASPVDFAPAAGGSRTTDGYSTVTISSLPSTTNLKFRFTLLNNSANERWVVDDFKLIGADSEINIQGNGVNITDGDTTPSTTDNTDFGLVAVGSSTNRPFVIQNTGTGALTLTSASPYVSISGANAADFSVSIMPSTPVAALTGSSTFEITFTPSASGLRTATVSIANNDTNENPYDFTIQGTGTVCTSAVISSVYPTSGPQGTIVTVNASSGNLTSASALVGGVAATVLSSSPTKLVLVVPAGASSGGILITDTQPCTATTAFTYIDKSLTSCEGSSGVYTDLIISEIYDAQAGSGGVIELYNGTAAPIDMGAGQYKLRRYANFTDTGAPAIEVSLTGVIAAGQIIMIRADATVICAAQVGTPYGTLGSGFNADDRIDLTKGAGNTVIDRVRTRNNVGFTMIRISLTGPSATFNDADWNSNDTESCSNLGIFDSTPPIAPIINVQPTLSLNCTSSTAAMSVTASEGFVGSNSLTYNWFALAPNTTNWVDLFASPLAGHTGANTATLNVSSLTSYDGYQYYCQVRENTSTCYKATVAVQIYNGTLIWNGTDWRDVNNISGTPSLTKPVIIAANYNTGIHGSFSACSVTVAATYNATVAANTYINIQNGLTVLGTFDIKDTGALCQIDDSGINTGNITMDRSTSSPIVKMDYVYWSSPIKNFNVSNISPNTMAGYIFKWNPILPNPNGGQGYWVSAVGDAMIPGKGYIVRGPNDFIAPQVFSMQFANNTADFGKPNNGIITPTISRGDMTTTTLGSYTSANGVALSEIDDNWNLVGNPYPSAISVFEFLKYNAVDYPIIDGFVKIWTHGTPPVSPNNPFYASYQYNYSNFDFIVHNGTATLSGPLGFNGFIAAGQGFIVSMNEGNRLDSTLTFNNSMRVRGVNDNVQFFRQTSANHTQETTSRSRIWLDLVNASGVSARTVVGYLPEATNAKDVLYDAFIKLDPSQNIYSLIADQTMCIQGRSAFDNNDSVPLGVVLPTADQYRIAIGAVDGIFENGQQIFLKDKIMHTIHDLRQSPYTFNSEITGQINDRFELVYQNQTLSNDTFETSNPQVIVTSNSNEVTVQSSMEMVSVEVYDLLGRMLCVKSNLSVKQLFIQSLMPNQQTLIVKVKLNSGQVVTKKIIF